MNIAEYFNSPAFIIGVQMKGPIALNYVPYMYVCKKEYATSWWFI